MKIYRVGGAIRDRILKLKAKDSDYVVVGSTESEMIEKGFKKVWIFFSGFFLDCLAFGHLGESF